MQEFSERVVEQMKEMLNKLSNTQKIILGVIGVVIIVALIWLISFSSTEEKTLLYAPKDGLKKSDYQTIKDILDKKGVEYTYHDERRLIWVSGEEEAKKLRTQLAIDNNMVPEVKGWELFDDPSFTQTDYDRDVNLRRAIEGSLVKHLLQIDDIEKVSLEVAWPEREKFFKSATPLSASVILTPAPYSDITEDKSRLKGIQKLVAAAIDRLEPENVHIEDNTGRDLTWEIIAAKSDEEIKQAYNQIKIEQELKQKMLKDLDGQLRAIYGDRYYVIADLDIVWDKEKVKEKYTMPLILEEPNPPFSEGKVKDGLRTGKKTITEEYEGPYITPEGPAGVEPNLTPGLTEVLDRHSKYKKVEEIESVEKAGEKVVDKVKQPYEIKGRYVSVVLDGKWVLKVDKEDGTPMVDKENPTKLLREYVPVSDDELTNVKKLVDTYVVKNRATDKVNVTTVPFDRRDQFEKRDQEYFDEQEQKQVLLISIFGILFLLIVLFAWRFISKYLAKKRKQREEELAREQQKMREQALRKAEEEGVLLDMSPEDRARLEMQENAINLARERPEDVAQLIRTWIAEE